MTIGERLKEWRKENNLTLKEIHETTGISMGNLSDNERDKYIIGVPSLIKLHENYDLDLQYIITGIRKQDKNEEKSEYKEKILELLKDLNEEELIIMYGFIRKEVRELVKTRPVLQNQIS